MISILELIIIRVLCIAVARMSIHVPFQRGTVGTNRRISVAGFSFGIIFQL
jgi:hypothetical protein